MLTVFNETLATLAEVLTIIASGIAIAGAWQGRNRSRPPGDPGLAAAAVERAAPPPRAAPVGRLRLAVLPVAVGLALGLLLPEGSPWTVLDRAAFWSLLILQGLLIGVARPPLALLVLGPLAAGVVNAAVATGLVWIWTGVPVADWDFLTREFLTRAGTWGLFSLPFALVVNSERLGV